MSLLPHASVLRSLHGDITSADYKNNLKELELFLKGKFRSLESVWEKQMKQASGEQQYEKLKSSETDFLRYVLWLKEFR
jgi:excinuclease UvrABC nuclease subunit